MAWSLVMGATSFNGGLFAERERRPMVIAPQGRPFPFPPPGGETGKQRLAVRFRHVSHDSGNVEGPENPAHCDRFC